MDAEPPWGGENPADVDHQAHEPESGTEEQGSAVAVIERPSSTPAAVVRAREMAPPARVPAPKGASLTPGGDALRAWTRDNAEQLRASFVEALGAVKSDRLLGEIPDYAVRLRAAEAILNRAEGMPTQRTELSGAVGLAALLAPDARDVI